MGLITYWAGYYAALVTAWRGGVRGVSTVLAFLGGICCCGGVTVLWVHGDKLQKRLFAAIADGEGDADLLRARTKRFYVATAVAVIGMLMQIISGYMAPEDDDVDLGSSSYEYSYESYEDETGDSDEGSDSIDDWTDDSTEGDSTEGDSTEGDSTEGDSF
ncbi:MAG TPA: hypothetical protein VIL20_18750 [Sandaracinaceae bacterium]